MIAAAMIAVAMIAIAMIACNMDGVIHMMVDEKEPRTKEDLHHFLFCPLSLFLNFSLCIMTCVAVKKDHISTTATLAIIS